MSSADDNESGSNPRADITRLVAELGGNEAALSKSAKKKARKGKEGEPVIPATAGAPADESAVVSADTVQAPVAEPNAQRLAVQEASGGVVDHLPIDSDDDLSAVEGEVSLALVSVIESLLFAAPRPLKVRDLRRVLQDHDVRAIQLALRYLIHERHDRGIVVMQMAGGFVLTTHRDNAAWVSTLLQAKPTRLSRPQLECLAVVAYRQPVTRPEIEHVRGVDCGAALKGLLERELVQVVGRAEEVGRPLLYGTTVHFLEFFSLMSLRDLPDLREFKEISASTMDVLRAKVGDDEAEVLGQEVRSQAASDAEPGIDSDTSNERSGEADQDEGHGSVDTVNPGQTIAIEAIAASVIEDNPSDSSNEVA